MSKPKFPMTVRRGHTVVKVYKTPSNGCDQFTLSYYLGERRIRKTFSDSGLAITEAETIATKLSQGELNVVELKGEDRLAYVRAVQLLAPTGVPLEMAAMHFAEAFKILNGGSLKDAAEFYMKHHPDNMPKKLVSEVVAELIAAKEADRLSDVYLKDLRGRLRRFAEVFTGRICLVTAAEIETWLRTLKDEPKNGKTARLLSPTSRNNYRRAVGTLFYFAETRNYVSKGIVDIEGIAMAKEEQGEIEVFRPEEMARFLSVARPEMVPFLAIGAFAGLRTAEIQRLQWSEVRLEDGFIEVKAKKAKTGSRRLVPITDNLKAWLLAGQPEGKLPERGPVCQFANTAKQIVWLVEAANEAWRKEQIAAGKVAADLKKAPYVWKHNAMRHSFISYRLADIQNVAQVALEAGNSPQIIFSNYRELVRPVDAKKWFAIMPTVKAEEAAQPANVLPMPTAVTPTAETPAVASARP